MPSHYKSQRILNAGGSEQCSCCSPIDHCMCTFRCLCMYVCLQSLPEVKKLFSGCVSEQRPKQDVLQKDLGEESDLSAMLQLSNCNSPTSIEYVALFARWNLKFTVSRIQKPLFN
ncbi:hypothetical protein AMECASPLE_024448 [Ameca splendens]|uniref:Uncharacterized protein n=1 Tax=Ameca splendens TaxID=208324 RepID=A0ABV0Y4I2_9TELE